MDSSDERLDESLLNDDVCPGSMLQLCDRAVVALGGSVGEKMFLPVFRSTCLGGDEKGMGVVVVCGQGFVFVSEEEPAFVNQCKEEDGKSFAVSPHWAMDVTDSQLFF